jgi:hypothetical protein
MMRAGRAGRPHRREANYSRLTPQSSSRPRRSAEGPGAELTPQASSHAERAGYEAAEYEEPNPHPPHAQEAETPPRAPPHFRHRRHRILHRIELITRR